MKIARNTAAVYICDHNHHDITQYSLASFAESSIVKLDFKFYQFEYQKPISSTLHNCIVALGHTIELLQANCGGRLDVRNKLASFGDISSSSIYTAILKAAAIEAVAPHYSEIFYVDGDVLALTSIDLQQHFPNDKLFSAGFDITCASGLTNPDLFERASAAGLSSDYFNSGVMIVNSRRWLTENCLSQYESHIRSHIEICPYFGECVLHDQCAFNLTANNDWRRLPISMNAQKSLMHTGYWKSATLRHYTGARKFIPVRLRTADSLERRLLRRLSRRYDLELPGTKFNDLGASYALNGWRKENWVKKVTAAADLLSGKVQIFQ
jgi:lipopolysaccharide biosynthesis glycosyltransferase